jgi:DNA-directed RNA polymerase subunit beta'
VPGESIVLNPLVCKGFNADFDGDAMTVHVPVSDDAVEEAKKMMPSKHLFKSGYNDLLVMPSQGALLGLYYMTHQGKGKKGEPLRTFSDMDALDQAYQRNEIKIDTPIQVRHSPAKMTTYGREILEQSLPKDIEIPKEFNKVTLSEFIKGISGRKDAVKIINTLKDLGFQYVYQAGASLGLDDFPKVDMGSLIRGTTLDIERKISQGEVVTKKALKDRDSMLHPIIESGSRAKWRQAMEMTAAPGFYSSIMEKVIPLRIDKSYAEGLTPGQFWASTYGARRAEISKSLMTAMPGDLAKTLLATVSDVVIAADDMGDDGIEMSIKDPDIVDRFTAKDVTEGDKVLVPQNTLITDEVLDTLKKSYIMKIFVRSPLTARNPHGIPARSFGLHEDGNLPAETENIGIRAGHALAEPLTQTALGSFHTGGMTKRKKATYWDVEKLFVQPRVIKNAAVLSPVEGEITEVKKHDDGLYEINIRPEGKKSDISTKSKLFFPPIVKKDAVVKKGQNLTLGDTDYRELLKLVGLKDMQLRLTHDLHEAYHNIGIPVKQRYIETVVRKLTDNARVTDIGNSNYSPGDWVSVYELEDYNRKCNPGDKPVGYELVPAGIKTRVGYEEDWPKRLVFGQKVMKNSITEGASQKWSADLYGDSPWTTWLIGGDGEVNIDDTPDPA